MTIPLLTAALLMGFFGSPHCLGMCGGLVTAFGLSMQKVSPAKRRGLIATYHLGRLLSYSILGLIAGLIGTALLAPIMNSNAPRVLLGLVFIFIGMAMLGMPFLNKLERLGMKFWQWLSPLRQKVFPLTTFPRALAAGLLWGFLPCGLVYGALLVAVVGHNVLTGAALMFVFGLGTVPMLVATHETVGWLHKQIGRFRLRQLNGVMMALSGLAIIAVPIMMGQMHGGHGHHHGGNHMNHTDHATMISDSSDMLDNNPMTHHMSDDEHMQHHHDMSQHESMHDMDSMNHDHHGHHNMNMENMDMEDMHNIHSEHDMNHHTHH